MFFRQIENVPFEGDAEKQPMTRVPQDEPEVKAKKRLQEDISFETIIQRVKEAKIKLDRPSYPRKNSKDEKKYYGEYRQQGLAELDFMNVIHRCYDMLPKLKEEESETKKTKEVALGKLRNAFAATYQQLRHIALADPRWIVEVKGTKEGQKNASLLSNSMDTIGLLDRRAEMYNIVKQVAEGKIEPGSIEVTYHMPPNIKDDTENEKKDEKNK